MRTLSVLAVVCWLEALALPALAQATEPGAALIGVSGRISCPTPSCWTGPTVLTITPDGSTPFQVEVKRWSWDAGACLPDSGAFVEVAFGPEADNLVAWGSGQVHPIITGIADAEGKISFAIRGSGCVPEIIPGGTFTVQIRADGIVLAEVGVNSPDAVNASGQLPVQAGHNTCENGITKVSLSDTVFHTWAIKMGLVEPCSRFTGPVNQPVTIADAMFLTPYIRNGTRMTCP